MGENEDVGDVHEGRKPHGRPLVVHKLKHGAPKAAGVGSQEDAIGYSAHGKLPHPEVHHPSGRSGIWPLLRAGPFGPERGRAFYHGIVGSSQIRASAPQLRHHFRYGVEGLSGRSPGGEGVQRERGFEIVYGPVKSLREAPRAQPLVQGRSFGVLALPGLKLFHPGFLGFLSPLDCAPRAGEEVGIYLEGLVFFKPEFLFERFHGLFSQGGAVGLFASRLAGRGPGYDGVHLYEVRAVCDLPRLLYGPDEGLNIFLVALGGVEAHPVGVPAVALVAPEDVFGEGDGGVPFDLDPVAVEDCKEVAELLGPGKGRSLSAHPLLYVPFAAQRPHFMGEQIASQKRRFEPRGHGEAHCGGNSLAQGSGRHFDPLRQAVFGVAGGLGVHGPVALYVVQGEVARQEELHVLRQGCVAGREDESVPALPLRIQRIVPENVLVEGVDDRGHGDCAPGVAASRLLHGVGYQPLGHGYGSFVQIGFFQLIHFNSLIEKQ